MLHKSKPGRLASGASAVSVSGMVRSENEARLLLERRAAALAVEANGLLVLLPLGLLAVHLSVGAAEEEPERNAQADGETGHDDVGDEGGLKACEA